MIFRKGQADRRAEAVLVLERLLPGVPQRIPRTRPDSVGRNCPAGSHVHARGAWPVVSSRTLRSGQGGLGGNANARQDEQGEQHRIDRDR
jgi:hypothetical protein